MYKRLSWHSTTQKRTPKTTRTLEMRVSDVRMYRRVRRVGVGVRVRVGVVECQLYATMLAPIVSRVQHTPYSRCFCLGRRNVIHKTGSTSHIALSIIGQRKTVPRQPETFIKNSLIHWTPGFWDMFGNRPNADTYWHTVRTRFWQTLQSNKVTNGKDYYQFNNNYICVAKPSV